MSLLFTCGSNGCDVTEIDDNAVRETSRIHKNWASFEEMKHGEFPDWEAQVEWWANTYTRLTEIKLI